MAIRKKQMQPQDYTVQYVRGVIAYLCILSLFGCVILMVQAGMDEKRIRYDITDQIGVKRELLNENRKLDNRIAELERFERIAMLVEEEFPDLKPPQHPAISIGVDGLLASTKGYQRKPVVYQDDSWLGNARRKWRDMEHDVYQYLNSLVE
jgi:hypothetical protein